MRGLRIFAGREWSWGAAAVALFIAVWLLDPVRVAAHAREVAFAVLGELFPRSASAPVVVIDIDRESLARLGAWPWRRSLLADLVTAAAAGKPRAIAIDILLAGPDRKGPLALARELAAALGDGAPPQLAAGVPDDDEVLAGAIAKAGNVVLGIVLDDAGRDPPPFSAPIRGDGTSADIHPWRAEGLVAPHEPLTRGAAGVGVLSFRDGPLGAVADAPVLALAGDEAFPGLAAETARIAQDAAGFVLKGRPARLAAGTMDIPLDREAGMRLHPSSDAAWAARSIPAWRLLSGGDGRPDLAGKIVLIGSTAPEAAALLPFGGRPLASTVQIQADAVDQMLSGDFLIRPSGARWIEAGLMALLGGVTIALAARLSPLLALGSATLMILAWLAATTTAFRHGGWLLDPVGPPSAILVGCAATLLAGFIRTRALRTAIQGQFERYLAPEIVRRLARDPDMLRLEGEEREITALMTDVEGFSAMTERVDARALVHVLDAYFDGITELVVAHGGLVDKIVGDAVLAFFNMPADLPYHPRAAVRCAAAIQTFTQAFRRSPAAAAMGFGRTRCGVETGPAIVGDVGGRRRLDYTAYGVVVNKAARFQDANKRLGSTICIGSVAAARLDGATLRSLGRIEVRGMAERCELFEPWDEAVPAALRALYRSAADRVEADPVAARHLFADYAAACPGDRVVAAWLEGRLPVS